MGARGASGLDLKVESGEVVAIVGASGAGKSTLLQILGTLDVPNQGELHIDGTPVHGMSRARSAGSAMKTWALCFNRTGCFLNSTRWRT